MVMDLFMVVPLVVRFSVIAGEKWQEFKNPAGCRMDSILAWQTVNTLRAKLAKVSPAANPGENCRPASFQIKSGALIYPFTENVLGNFQRSA
jgi:hypothetical protein